MSHNIIKINKTDTKVVRIVSEGPQGPTGARGAQGPTGSIFPHNANAIGYIENNGQAILTGSLFITSSISGSGQSWLTGGGHITASGNITALGNITGLTGSFDYISLTGSIASDGNITANTGSFQQLLLDGNVLINQDTTIISSGDYDLTIDPSDNIYIGNNNADNIYIGKNSGDNFVKIEAGGSDTVFISGSKVGLGNQYPQQTLSVTGDISSSGNLTVAGNITASGNISGSSTTTLTIGGSATFGTSTVVIDGTAGHITASGNISASGTIYANNFSSTGGNVDGISFTDELNLTGNLTSSGNISSSGNLTVGGNITASGDISSSGTITAANLSVGGTGGTGLSITGDITASGHISTSLFSSGSFGHLYVGEISASNRPGSSSGIIRAFDGKYTTITSSNAIIHTASFGVISSSITPDITDKYTLGTEDQQWKDLYVGGTGYIDTLDSFSTTNITASGHVSITGDLTASVISASGNISTTGDLDIYGKSYFEGDITASGHVSASGNLILSGHITSSGNISASGYISASGLEIAGSSISLLGGHITASGNISASGNIINTGTFITTNITASGNISSSGGTIIASTITLGGGGTPGVLTTANINSTGSVTASIVSASSLIATTADIDGGSIDGTSIGAATPSTGVFSTLKSNGFLSSSGNLVVQGSGSISGDLTVGGIVSANEIHVTVISSSITHTTGSNTFGDALDDIHNFTGSLIVSNSLNVVGGITSSGDIDLNGSINVSNSITASGDISASGNIEGTSFKIANSTILQGSTNVTLGSAGSTGTISLETHGRKVLTVNGDDNVEITGSLVTTDNITTGGNLHLSASGGHITASGDISASGTITAANLNIGGTGGAGLSLTGDITASGNISASGIIYAEHLYSSDDAEITDNLIIGGHITSSGNISSSGGHITAQYYDASTVATGFRLGGSNILYFKTNNGGVAAYTFGRQNSPTLISGSSIELGRETTTHVTASGDISASGAMHMQTAKIYGTAIINSHITASGDISQSHTATSSLSQLTVHNNLYIKDGLLKVDNTGEGATYYENDKINFYYSPDFTIQEEDTDIVNFASGSIKFHPNITASGDISSSGTITAANLNIGGTGGTGLNVVGDITASGNISASGTIFANNFTSTGGNTSGITFDDDMNLTGDITASGYIHLSDGYGMNWGIENRTKIIGHEANDTITLTVDNSNTKNLRLSNYGVGINMLSLATSSLQVAGDIWASGSEGHITASGNISSSGEGYFSKAGIGTSSPSTTLHILSSEATKTIIEGDDGSSLLRLKRTDVDKYFDLSMEGNDLRFNPGVLDNTQNVLFGVNANSDKVASRVGIGDATPSVELSVSGSISATGHITASGNISSSGTVKALTGSFGVLTGLSPMTFGSPVTFTAPVTMSSHISASTGTVYAEHFHSSHDAEVTNHLTVKTISNVDTTHVTASGDVSASGKIITTEITSSGDVRMNHLYLGQGLTKIKHYTDYIGFFYNTGGAKALKIGSLAITNDYSDPHPSNNGLYVKGDISSSNISLINITSSGIISASSTIETSDKFVINGSGCLLRITRPDWTNATDHDMLYNGWEAGQGDYVYLKAAGNSATNHGIVVISDAGGFYIGNNNGTTGAISDNISNPLDRLDFRVDIGGNVTASNNISASGNLYITDITASNIDVSKGYFGSKIGIGTTAPEYQIHISSSQDSRIDVETDHSGSKAGIWFHAQRDNGTTNSSRIYKSSSITYWETDADLRWNANGMKWMSGHNTSLRLYSSSVSNETSTEYVRFDHTNKRVGIGTSSPQTTLHLKDTGGQASGGLRFENAYDIIDMYFNANTDDSSFNISYNGTSGPEISLQADGDIVLNGGGSTGNVGIGTTAPSGALHIHSSTTTVPAASKDGTLIVEKGSAPSIQILSENTQTQAIEFGDPEDSDVGRITYAHPTDDMKFVTAGTTRMTVDGSGNVGIGTTDPGNMLHLSSSAGAILEIESSDSSSDAGITFNTLRSGSGMGGSHLFKSGSQTYWFLDEGLYWNSNNKQWMFGNHHHTLFYSSSNNNETVTSYAKFNHTNKSFELTGNLTSSANISSSGNIIANQITASYFVGDGSGLTNVNTTAITGLMTNGVDNRLVTATGVSSLDAEANLQFDDATNVLYLTGSMGIGTTTPSYALDVHGDGVNGMIRAYGSSIGRLSLQNSTRHYSLSVQNSNLYFYDETGGSTRMLLNSTGNLGIGTTGPAEKLTVAGNISSSGNLITEGYLTTETHITASGNISSSGTIYASDMVFDIDNLKNATDDTDAAAQSVPVGGIYRNGNILSIRIT